MFRGETRRRLGALEGEIERMHMPAGPFKVNEFGGYQPRVTLKQAVQAILDHLNLDLVPMEALPPRVRVKKTEKT